MGNEFFKEGSDLLVFASVDLRRHWRPTIVGSEIGTGIFSNVTLGNRHWALSPRIEGGGTRDPLM